MYAGCPALLSPLFHLHLNTTIQTHINSPKGKREIPIQIIDRLEQQMWQCDLSLSPYKKELLVLVVFKNVEIVFRDFFLLSKFNLASETDNGDILKPVPPVLLNSLKIWVYFDGILFLPR